MLLSRYLKAIWKKKCMVGLLKKVKEIVSSSAFSSLVFAYNWIEHRGRNFRCVPFQQMLYWLLVLTGHFLLFTAFDSLDPLLIKKHIWGIWNPATRFPSPIFFCTCLSIQRNDKLFGSIRSDVLHPLFSLFRQSTMTLSHQVLALPTGSASYIVNCCGARCYATHQK